jgi:hypothetical protein
MSRRIVRHLTAAAVLALALSLAGPGMAAAGSFEVAVPATQESSWLDLFLGWLSGLWGGETAGSVDKSTTTTTSTTGTGGTTSSGTLPTGNPLGEQGGAIDPDG